MRINTRFLQNYKWKVPTTWGVNSLGQAFNNPSLSAELYVNPGFDADTDWIKGTGWTISGGKAVGTVATGTITQLVAVSDNFHLTNFDLVTRTAGAVRSTAAGGSSGPSFSVPGRYPYTYVGSGSAVAGLTFLTNFSGTCDNASIKMYTRAEVFALFNSPDLLYSLSAILSLQNPYMNGIIAYADKATNPSSFLQISSILGTGSIPAWVFRKCVNGIWTNIIVNTPVAFVAGAAIEVRRLRNTNLFQMVYNNVQVGTNIDVSDPEIINNTYHGIMSLDSSNQSSNLRMNGQIVPFNF